MLSLPTSRRVDEWAARRVAGTEPARQAAQYQLDGQPVRYALCWEDADILLAALDINEHDVCLSIASAGDNTLSLLSRAPQKVLAIDTNPSQLACLEFRRAAFTALTYEEMLVALGLRKGDAAKQYRRLRQALPLDARAYWDARPNTVKGGIVRAGKFENYFAIFRRMVLPLVHRKATVHQLLQGGSQRKRFYDSQWNSSSWRGMFKIFFSQQIMGLLGRDRECFAHADKDVAESVFDRTEYALTELDPAQNPYLHYILTGTYGEVLPHAFRAENFEAIRANLHKLELRQASLGQVLSNRSQLGITKFNLSDVFEYMPEPVFVDTLKKLPSVCGSQARLAYWNMIVPRVGAEVAPELLVGLNELASELHKMDRAFFYQRFVVEELRQ